MFISDLITWATFVSVTIGAFFAVTKFPPSAWLIRRLITEPLATFARGIVDAGTEPLREQQSRTDRKVTELSTAFESHKNYVGRMLGPNGSTPPLHARIAKLEIANEIEPPYNPDDYTPENE
jgi:hypothetical protein